jgi:predicted HicB family RNase H-like nuclease
VILYGSRNRAALEAVFAEPIRSGISWREVEVLLIAAGAEVTEGQGWRVRVALNGVRALPSAAPVQGNRQGGGEIAAALSDRSWNRAMNTMHYKGYEAIVDYDEEAEIFHGEVADLREVITFEGSSVAGLKQAFADSVEDYLAFCRARGEEPEKPFSGQFVVRTEPSLHRAAAAAARRQGMSLNKWVASALERAVES